MSYDPTLHSARCDLCPLQGNIVVPAEGNFNRMFAVVGEAPGEGEERTGRPFVGPSGAELERAIRSCSIKRNDIFITNTVLCRPPKNEMKLLLQKISKHNKAHPNQQIHSPIECCKPRLDEELSHFRDIITLGGTALKAVTGVQSSVIAVRGGLMELDATETAPARRVMPSVHPAFVLRSPRWAHVLRNDIRKGIRWFKGIADWGPPQVVYNPSLL